MNLRALNQTVKPPVAHLDQLKHEVYTLGTSMRQVSSESGMSTETVKSILSGNNVEQSTAARLAGYLTALARNEFHATRELKRYSKGHMSGPAMKLERKYYAMNKELWREYRITTMHPDDFAKLDRRKKLLELLKKERMLKVALMSKHKPFIERYRVWMADGWSYWRWRSYLKERIAKAALAGG